MSASHSHNGQDHPLHGGTPHGHAPDKPYETRDANIKSVIETGVSMFVVTFVAMILMYGLFKGFQALPTQVEPPPMVEGRPLPPLPHLQVNQQRDLAAFRARENEILSTYGKLPSGGVRLPIERAMDILAARGFTAAAPAPPVPGASAERKGAAAKKGAPAR